jgi:hypothetical protein
MKDTPAAMEQLYTRKLLNLAPEERLAMACRMFSAAKALIRSGISTSGAMSTAEIRALVFLRLYGQDFDQAERAKVLAQLGAT